MLLREDSEEMTLEAKKDVLRRLLQERSARKATPFSSAQQRLWLLDAMDPASCQYNIAALIRARGPLDVALLERCLAALASRHECLRARFKPGADGNPVQEIDASMALDISREALEPGLGIEGGEARLVAFAREPFDLKAGPCWRCRIAQVDADTRLVGLVFHHIIADGWSLNLFWKELVVLYRNGGDASSLDAAPARYSDFVEEERRWQSGAVATEMTRYWAERLDGVPSLLELPWDRAREPLGSFQGRRVELSLDAGSVLGLEALARDSRCTLFALLMSAYRILLYRYSGQEDFCVGYPVANRESSRFARSFGLFINTLVHRARIDDSLSFVEFMKQAHGEIREDLIRQALPFSTLLGAAKVERNPSFNPLFQAMLIMQNASKKRETVGAVAMELDELDIGVAKFDLTIEANRIAGGLKLVFEYNSRLFDADSIERMVASYAEILTEAIARPSVPLRELRWIPEDERETVLRRWNRTEADFPDNTRFEAAFEQQAMRSPDAPAAVCSRFATPLCYGDLERKANQLARLLVARGLEPGGRVGICMSRSSRLLVAILGAFKAGASYVPLDPTFPEERLRFMAKDAELSCLIFESSLPGMSDVVAQADTAAIDWDSEETTLESLSPEPLGLVLSADAVAYTIYTSGSTGQPKGVQIQHRALLNFLASMARQPGLARGDRLLSVTTLSFDISILELLLPLFVGAQVAIAERDAALDGAKLSRELEARGITCMQATPATWRLLIDSGWRGKADLKMLCGGEALPHDLAMRLLEKGRELWNMYGPTETTIWSSAQRIESSDTEILIGPPIANTQFYVLDRNRQPLPRGVAGELYIGGEGLSLGYWKRPELTAAAFATAPANWGDGQRIYRVGDLVKWREGGRLAFLGRADFQVKVRGFRIELGEIESALRTIEGARQCVCLAREDRPGDQRLVAYLILGEGARFDEPAARRALKARLPQYMIPSAFVALKEFPQTPNGKIDRKRLPAPSAGHEAIDVASKRAPVGGLYGKVGDIFKQVLGVDRVGLDDSFFDLGGHSMLLATLHSKLSPLAEGRLELMELFRYPTVRGVVERLSGGASGEIAGASAAERPRSKRRDSEAIAIVGMSCRFPGALDTRAFWRMLEEGREGIADISEADAAQAGVDPALFEDPKYVRRFGRLENADRFDASFFGYRPREAEIMDPQQRVFLEVCHEALEDALCDPQRFGGAIGVFAGVGISSYGASQIDASDPSRVSENYQAMIGNDKDFLATRVAHRLNLRGPAMSVQTACSTSLVAVHLACESLLSGDSDIALAGGSSMRFPQEIGYVYEEGMILSPDGRCRAFDERAQGTVGGSGAGVVALKRLSDALKDGDRVYAAIRGSAVNNDGAQKIGYTAPSLEGQSKAIQDALAAAGVDPASVGYVEAHGTGTPLGDPIEVAALRKAYGSRAAGGRARALGSVKTNIGHLDTAAGVAGLIKAALAVEQGRIPPTLWFGKANPKLMLEESGFYVNAALEDWRETGGPRRAGVSSFGIGGTNAHVILEQVERAAPASTAEEPKDAFEPALFCLSAKTATALEARRRDLADLLEKESGIRPSDAAYSLHVGRGEFAYRSSFVCAGRAEAIEKLRDAGAAGAQDASERNGALVFMFSGQGSQYPGMARELYESIAQFRETVDRCFDFAAGEFERDPRELLFPRAEDAADAAALLQQTRYAQPALFVIEYALARYWMSIGARPASMIGHSVGEYVCACVSEALAEPDALRLICARGRLMQAMPKGSMLAISESPEFVAELAARSGLDLAAVNSPRASVVSGPAEAVARAMSELEAKEIPCRELHASHAFHSRMMDGMLDEFERLVATVSFASPKIPYISNLTGDWIAPEQLGDPKYWREHLRSTVRFADGIATIIRSEPSALLEVGPGSTLKTFATHQALGKPIMVETSLPRPNEAADSRIHALNTLGRLWEGGAKVDWSAFHAGSKRTKVDLPYYPFERQRFYIETAGRGASAERDAGRRQPLQRWMYAPVWRRSARVERPRVDSYKRGLALVFGDDLGFLDTVAESLAATGTRIVTVSAGDAFEEIDDAFRIRPEKGEDYDRLLRSVARRKEPLDRILHGWNLTSEAVVSGDEERCFFGLLRLAQAFGALGPKMRVDLRVFANRLHRVVGDEAIDPMKSLLAGPARVIPQEFDGLSCQSLDVPIAQAGGDAWERLVDLALRELESPIVDRTVAFRGGHRWTRDFERLEDGYGAASDAPLPSGILKENGAYWVVGGLGGVGNVLARHLAKSPQAKLLVTGRLQLPSPDQWQELSRLPTKEGSAALKLLALQESGAQLIYRTANVLDAAELSQARDAALAAFGRLDGVIHAAGVAGDGLILGKAREAALRTLAPKVRGALALRECLREIDFDFLLLCSSVTAEHGGIGQVDYCSANAFLDAFAQSQDAGTERKRVISVQWDAWSESGMAARALRKGSSEPGGPAHPLVGEPVHSGETADVFGSEIQASRDWVLSEHWILGRPTVPGTTYLDMARAAAGQLADGQRLVLSNVYFMSPLSTDDEGKVTLRTALQRQGDRRRFSVLSRSDATEAGFWRQHLTLDIAIEEGSTQPERADLETLRRRCSVRRIDDPQQLAGFGRIVDKKARETVHSAVEFGLRWQNLTDAWLGDGEGLARLELPAQYKEDLDTFRLHPALLDCATAFLRLIVQEGIFLPLSYERIVIWRDLTPVVYSHAVAVESARADKGAASFDVRIYDEAGNLLVEVVRFTLREIDEASLAKAVDGAILTSLDLSDSAGSTTGFQKEIAKQGIKDREGAAMLSRVLDSGNPQVLVSTREYAWSKARFDALKLGSEIAIGAARKSQAKHARPNLKTPYVAPSGDMELAVAALWEPLLGIERIGALDDVFELGSDSLLLVQFHKALASRFETDISVVDLYKYTNVKDLAKRLDQGAPKEAAAAVSMDKVAGRVSKAKDARSRRKERGRQGRA